MSLDSLPVEIQNNIFFRLDDQSERQYADNGYPTLCALALTCRRLSDTANNLLYSHIKLEINGEMAKDADRMAALNKCCREYPYLVDRINSAELRWCYRKDVETYNELLGHLAKSTSLTRLACELNQPTWTVLPALYDYSEGSFAQLNNLEIELNRVKGKEDYVPAEQLAKLAELPKLEIFTVCAPVTGFKTEARSEKILNQLKHFHFWKGCPTSVAALESILPKIPNLTCLQLSVPGDGTQIDRKMANNSSMLGFDLDEPLRPSSYGDLLAPVAASLKHLVIDAENVLITSHDGSHIDLSHFINVSLLELSASLLFGSGGTAASCAWVWEIWKFLPPRVENFDILFDGDQGLFWSLGDMRQHARSNTFDQLWERTLKMDYIDWLLGLLSRNRNNTASFRSITINELPIVDRDQNWKIVEWKLTDDLTTAAAAAGVKLTIRLRVPRRFKSSEFVLFEEAWAYGAEGTVTYEEDNNEESAGERDQ
ncbi:hypothetical protein F4805DRAFT_436826 [Annulohypoxylon moriforme]|nr:hypothetical protein F4805DRAFT_436826 [Annulohypoxylon moriforme]